MASQQSVSHGHDTRLCVPGDYAIGIGTVTLVTFMILLLVITAAFMRS